MHFARLRVAFRAIHTAKAIILKAGSSRRRADIYPVAASASLRVEYRITLAAARAAIEWNKDGGGFDDGHYR